MPGHLIGSDEVVATQRTDLEKPAFSKRFLFFPLAAESQQITVAFSFAMHAIFEGHRR